MIRTRRRSAESEERTSHDRWLVSYADFITLLFAFFVVMFAISQVDETKLGRFSESVQAATRTQDANAAPQALPTDPAMDLGGTVSPTTTTQGPVPADGAASLRARLEGSLADAIRSGRVSVVETPEGIVVRLNDRSFFDSGSSRVSPNAEPDIARVAEVLRGTDFEVTIEGHTDSRPIQNYIYRSNWELSASRAASVLTVLSERARIPVTQLSVAGYADRKPLASNDTEEGRARNRRVEILVRGAR
jgi:chemotaxis protein MotB